MTDQKITQEYLGSLFGSSMPFEAMILLQSGLDDQTMARLEGMAIVWKSQNPSFIGTDPVVFQQDMLVVYATFPTSGKKQALFLAKTDNEAQELCYLLNAGRDVHDKLRAARFSLSNG